ncbi:acyclic terpene utilization AtuA family protein [Variovorax sp. dw_954]|uniref:acyclic terpene utilization AtuA family protein n=1 Tax=Variovorax sp. dw_954 TaxID=2720078 RepID=UPI001BD4CF8C|nr:acyclic terpene utilization AtuA family protein [Variovorax sp. dw_954]
MSRSTLRTHPLRIGCASGFWGDSEEGAAQLVRRGDIDYLVFDFLAEITMSLLARARAKSPEAGYAPDFVRVVAALAGEIQSRGIRVVSNAGGVNPAACARALAGELRALGVPLRIAVVEGDDLSSRADALRAAGTREMFSGAPMPPQLLSLNAYLGAQPIVAALDAGADIVITGRVVDSAVTLAPLVHEFGWGWQDWDRLATGSLAGHLIECGAQATGGLFTDWERVPGWEEMGFPIVECDPDGQGFTLTKPAGTGGLVEPATVAEQLVYEIGDPRAYLLPDVCCDFSGVTMLQAGPDSVRVTGARGRPAPATLKASATYADGWRLLGTLMIGGPAAARKAQRVGDAILARCRRLNLARGMADFDETSIEVLGAESTYGPHARTADSREVILKLAARHAQRAALDLLAREIAPSATSMAQGITGFAAGRPSPSPVVRLFSLRVDPSQVDVRVSLDGEPLAFEAEPVAHLSGDDSAPDLEPRIDESSPTTPTETVPLIRIAHARSGDKGDMANIGVIARSPAAYEFLGRVLDADSVASYFAHVCRGKVTRFAMPGCHAFNFTLENALGGGGVASLRYDPQGKAFAQMLLDLPVEVPRSLLQELP